MTLWSAGVERCVCTFKQLLLVCNCHKNADLVPRQLKPPLGKPGFGLTCKFNKALLHSELKTGGNYQIFRGQYWNLVSLFYNQRPGLSAQPAPSPPWLPGNFSPPASCFASSQKSSSQLLAHKIIKTSSKSEQPLTPPIPLLIVQINKSTLHH